MSPPTATAGLRMGGSTAPRTQEYIEKVLADWPPLTDQQRNTLAELLKPVRVGGDR
jgi:hypothetical protein